MREIKFVPIGIIHSPYKSVEDAPIQSRVAKGVKGTVVLEPQYQEGLRDLDGFSYIYLIFSFHLSNTYDLRVKPFLDNTLRGVFATRAPRRPNAIGLSIVKLLRIEGATLYIENPDMVDGTPLLDIKPYIPDFDRRDDVRIGWLADRIDKMGQAKSD